jgi:general secretion pathway protein I
MLPFLKNTLNFNRRVRLSLVCRNGFTLLEVMVSVAIIAIVLVSIIRLQGQTISMNETIRFYTLAPMLAESKLAEIILAGDFDLSDSGDFGEDYPGYTWKTHMEDLELDVFESPLIKMKKIDIAIDLNDGELKFSLRHFVHADSGAYDE